MLPWILNIATLIIFSKKFESEEKSQKGGGERKFYAI